MEKHQNHTNIPTRFRHRILDPISHHQPDPPEHHFELSEHEIFSTTQSNSSSPSSSHHSPKHTLNRTHSSGGGGGILAALNDPTRSRSGSDISPVFNHKASTSSSTSISPSTSILMIPKRPLPPAPRMFPQSAPVNVPVIPYSVRRRAMELEEAVSEEEEEEEDEEIESSIVPPHELIDSRDNRVMLSCSVLEGAGRTLKGRDLRQVRNAIWRRTGFID